LSNMLWPRQTFPVTVQDVWHGLWSA
jgi:hypothetical protein